MKHKHCWHTYSYDDTGNATRIDSQVCCLGNHFRTQEFGFEDGLYDQLEKTEVFVHGIEYWRLMLRKSAK